MPPLGQGGDDDAIGCYNGGGQDQIFGGVSQPQEHPGAGQKAAVGEQGFRRVLQKGQSQEAQTQED